MNLTDLEVIDKKTGEKIEGRLFFIPPKQKCGKFLMLFQEHLDEIAKNPTIKGTDLRLLLLLMKHTTFENNITTTAALLAADLKTTRSNIYASLTRLKNAGIIEKHPTFRAWRFTFTTLWKGKVKTLNAARTERLRNRKEQPT
jgi:DNA-binding MarR family transcriptional regulator